MYYRRLPTTRIALVSLGLFFACASIVFAQHTNTSSANSEPSTKKIVKHVETKHKKPTPTPTQKLAKAKITITPTPTTKALGGINLQTTPSPTPPTNPTAPILSISPTLAPTIPSTGSLLDQVNVYRATQGLGPVQSSGETCAFAATRAQEIASNFSHDAFNSRISSNTLPYAHWTGATENIAQTANQQNVVPMWINSPGHAANMRADTPYVCIQQYGDFYAYEGMKP